MGGKIGPQLLYSMHTVALWEKVREPPQVLEQLNTNAYEIM